MNRLFIFALIAVFTISPIAAWAQSDGAGEFNFQQFSNEEVSQEHDHNDPDQHGADSDHTHSELESNDDSSEAAEETEAEKVARLEAQLRVLMLRLIELLTEQLATKTVA